MQVETVGPWGDSNASRKGTHFEWKPSGRVTRIDLFGDSFGVLNIKFTSNNDSVQFGTFPTCDRVRKTLVHAFHFLEFQGGS